MHVNYLFFHIKADKNSDEMLSLSLDFVSRIKEVFWEKNDQKLLKSTSEVCQFKCVKNEEIIKKQHVHSEMCINHFNNFLEILQSNFNKK